MSRHNITHQEQFTIRASEIDFEQKATMPAICNLLQEIAGNHARELEFDITDLQKDELTWVLHRLRVQMDRFPQWRETIKIQTWPSGGDGLRAYRDFLILDSNDNTIGRSLSYWLILDMESRRPIRIPKKIVESVPKSSDHVLPETDTDCSVLESSNVTQSFEVRKTDLDLNRHVNNVRYIEWALSCLDDRVKINNIDIKFMGEAVLNDTVIASLGQQNSEQIQFELIRKADEKVLAHACGSLK